MIKKIYLFILIFTCSFMITSKVSALSFNDSYGNISSNNSNAIDLINYAISFDSFNGSDYVIFQSEQYSYYIVWGDLTYNNGSFTGKNIEYINYYRISTGTGYNYTYDYNYGTDTSFSFKSDYSVITNIDNAGLTNENYRIFDYNEKMFDLIKNFLILITGFIFVIMVKNLRRSQE